MEFGRTQSNVGKRDDAVTASSNLYRHIRKNELAITSVLSICLSARLSVRLAANDRLATAKALHTLCLLLLLLLTIRCTRTADRVSANVVRRSSKNRFFVRILKFQEFKNTTVSKVKYCQ